MAGRILPEFEFLTVTSGLRINPLTLNEVLETIFAHLSMTDLKSVRLVSNSSVWQTTSTTALLSSCSLYAPRIVVETLDDRIKLISALTSLLRKCPTPQPLLSLHIRHPNEFVVYLTIDILVHRVSHLKYEKRTTVNDADPDPDWELPPPESESEAEIEANMKSLAHILQYFPNLSQLTLTTDILDFSLSPCPASMVNVQRRDKGHFQLLEQLDELQKITLLYPLWMSRLRSFMDPEIAHQLHAINSIRLCGTRGSLDWILQEFAKANGTGTRSGGWRWNVEKIDLFLGGDGDEGLDVLTIREFLLQFASTLKQLHLNFKMNDEVEEEGDSDEESGDDDPDEMEVEGPEGPEVGLLDPEGPEGGKVGPESPDVGHLGPENLEGQEVGPEGPDVGPEGDEVGDSDDDEMDDEGQEGPEAGPEGHQVGPELGHQVGPELDQEVGPEGPDVGHLGPELGDHHDVHDNDAAAGDLGLENQNWRKDDWLLPQGLIKLSTLKIDTESMYQKKNGPELARTLIAALSLPSLVHLELITSTQCEMDKVLQLIYEKGRCNKFPHLGLESTSNCNDWIVQSQSLKELTIRHFGPIDQSDRKVTPPPSFLPSYLWPDLSSLTLEMQSDDWGNGVYILNIFAQYHKLQKLHLIFHILSERTWRERRYELRGLAEKCRAEYDKEMKEFTSKNNWQLGDTAEWLRRHQKREEHVKSLETQNAVLDSLFNGENEYDCRSAALGPISKSSSSSGSSSNSDFNLNSNLASNLKQLSLSRSLTNLKELRHLKIENQVESSFPVMTDFMIYGLLLKTNLKKLQSLEIRGHDFSAAAVQDLKQFLGEFVTVNV